MRESFIVRVGRDASGKTFRFTIGAHALIVGALLFVAFPVLFVAGSTWGARAVISDLLRQNAALQVENANYRDATAQLAAAVVRACRRRPTPFGPPPKSIRRRHERWSGCPPPSPIGPWAVAC